MSGETAPKKPALSGNVGKIEAISLRATEHGAVPFAQTSRVFDVPVVVDHGKCLTGCKLCVDSCPVDCLAIHPVYKKSFMKFDECWYCLACEVDCPTNAITVKMPFLLK
jgi:NAD-dependent dihydropyrimidine dehydrogenase PreA subunit